MSETNDRDHDSQIEIARLATWIVAIGGEEARSKSEEFARNMAALLSAPPCCVTDRAAWVAAVRHALAYYSWSWDPRAVSLISPLTTALEMRAEAPFVDYPAILALSELLYFVGWCFEASNVAQCRAVLPGLAAGARVLGREERPQPAPRAGKPKICLLSMFAERRSVMTLAPRLLLDALDHLPGGCEVSMVAWHFAEPDFLIELRARGVTVTVTGGRDTLEKLAEVEAAIAEVGPDILVTDMNNALPIAVFARRSAPSQVFLQAGLPAFPPTGLDAVFDSFGIGACETGWSAARVLPFQAPWDIEMLVPPVDPQQLQVERAMFPRGGPIAGTYGRLVKLTPDFLRAVERILQAVPEAHFVAGGTGDPEPIVAFAQGSSVGERIHVQQRFVPGHAWGRLLDLFLDTWPLTGGESVRECMAKGCPVVARHSDEMPALDLQRDPALLAHDWDDYVVCASRLLGSDVARNEAGQTAASIAKNMSDPRPFREEAAGAVAKLLEDARRRASISAGGRL